MQAIEGNNELKPCPFCGAKCEHTPRLSKGFPPLRFYAWVVCDCGAEGPSKLYDCQAIEAWNTRSPQ